MFTPAVALYPEAKRLIRERLDLPEDADNPLDRALEEGALAAEVLHGAEWMEVPSDWWVAPPIWRPNPYTQVLKKEGEVYPREIRLRTKDIDALWPPSEARLSERPKGGRPREHDWEGALIEVAAFVAQRGFPSVQQRLVELIREWFEKQDGGRAPDDKHIKARVKRLYERRGQT